MNQNTAAAPCLALIADGIPAAAEAARLVRRALADRGEAPWPAAEIEVWPGEEESLILAHPAPRERIYISAAAAAILSTCFGTEDY